MILRSLTIAFGFTFFHCLKVVFIAPAATIDEPFTLLRGRVVKVATEVGKTRTSLGWEGAMVSITLLWRHTRVTPLHIAIGTETTCNNKNSMLNVCSCLTYTSTPYVCTQGNNTDYYELGLSRAIFKDQGAWGQGYIMHDYINLVM